MKSLFLWRKDPILMLRNPVFWGFSGLPLEFIPHSMRGGVDGLFEREGLCK